MSTSPSRDPDIIASLDALKRAGRAARKLSRDTGTPFYVWRDGKVVDLNKPQKRTKARTSVKAIRTRQK